MGAGGSHPQAPMMPDPWATYKRPSTDEGQTTISAPLETNRCTPADRGVFAPTRASRGARPRSAARAPSTHPRGPNVTIGELQRKQPAEQELRLRRKKEEAWELFQRQSNFVRKTREEFEKKFSEKVLGGIYWNSKDDQEKDLQKWLNELQKMADLDERRLEALEKKRMGEEDAHSRCREAWDKIFQQPIPNLILWEGLERVLKCSCSPRSGHAAVAPTLFSPLVQERGPGGFGFGPPCSSQSIVSFLSSQHIFDVCNMYATFN